MKKHVTAGDWLPLAKTQPAPGPLPTGEAFRPEWIDFKLGLRIGNLEPHERITQILKYDLEKRYATPFVTDRWGRGVYWQWICWLPKANRLAKPLSHGVNFGCAKFFITTGGQGAQAIFKCGLQVERGVVSGPETNPAYRLREDWDWHRLVAQCRKGSALDDELTRLIRRAGFVAEIGDWEANAVFNRKTFRDAGAIRTALRNYADTEWAGFQLYYPMSAREVKACSGYDLVRAMCGAFREVVPAMNLCMQVPLQSVLDEPRFSFDRA